MLLIKLDQANIKEMIIVLEMIVQKISDLGK